MAKFLEKEIATLAKGVAREEIPAAERRKPTRRRSVAGGARVARSSGSRSSSSGRVASSASSGALVVASRSLGARLESAADRRKPRARPSQGFAVGSRQPVRSRAQPRFVRIGARHVGVSVLRAAASQDQRVPRRPALPVEPHSGPRLAASR